LYLLVWVSAVALADVVTVGDERPAAAPVVEANPPPAEPGKPGTTVEGSAPAGAANIGGTVASSDYAFLDCVRHRESRGDYRAVNPSGAAGAYQLMPATARAVANRAGRSDLAATPVVQWSPTDQDLMALVLYRWQGAAPWGGGCW
jgi:hypothetical protein